MTEAIVVIAMRDPHRRVLRTTGHVIRGMEHRLADEDGRPCRPGDVGRLQVRGPNIMRGYYKDPERTAEVLGADGWFDTRDLALVHADGSLRVIGRLDDTLVLTNGENVNAPYLENELCASEWIDRAVVVGEGKPYLAAFVVPSRTHLEGLARSLGLATDNLAALVTDERVLKHYRALVNAISGDAPPLRALRARAPRAPVARGVPHRPRALADAQAAAARVPAPVLRRDRRALHAVSAGRRGTARTLARRRRARRRGGGARLVALRRTLAARAAVDAAGAAGRRRPRRFEAQRAPRVRLRALDQPVPRRPDQARLPSPRRRGAQVVARPLPRQGADARPGRGDRAPRPRHRAPGPRGADHPLPAGARHRPRGHARHRRLRVRLQARAAGALRAHAGLHGRGPAVRGLPARAQPAQHPSAHPGGGCRPAARRARARPRALGLVQGRAWTGASTRSATAARAAAPASRR